MLHAIDLLTAASVPARARRWGNLWAFSTAKLESRGKKFKDIIRHQTSARPRDTATNSIKRKKGTRGGKASIKDKRTKEKEFIMVKGHDNVQVREGLAKMTFRERRVLALGCTGVNRRRREQLIILGKQDRERSVKTENNVPERWAELVPAGVPFTIEGLLKAMVTGIIKKPLYDIKGKHACADCE